MLDGLVPSRSHKDSLEAATATFEKNVDDLASYLQGRGIGREAACAQRLGFVSEPMPGWERFVGMMSIPYLTPGGVMAIKFRRIEGDGPKYDAPSGQSARLFNAGALAHTDSDTVLICEGELDAIVGTHALGVPSVGRPGGGTWLEHWCRCFADFDRVLIVADNDDKEDGSNPGLKSAKKVQSLIPESQLVLPPLGMDLNEWVTEAGADEVREAIGLASSPSPTVS